MYYNNYKIARDKAWETLIECGICELPINLAEVINHYGIYLIKYSDSDYVSRHSSPSEDGFSRLVDEKPVIYYNEKKPEFRIRFTVAHEIAHVRFDHLKQGETLHRNTEQDTSDPKEQQANVFARDLLMPATVLHSLNVKSADDISKICNVSKKSAEIRFNRLMELNKRGMYNKHPLERQVYNNFSTYIKKTSVVGTN